MAEVDVGPADLRSVEVGKRLVLLARDAGCTFALDDWCNHAGCLLSGGRIERAQVICPCHEVGFELASGKVATRPRICDDQPRFEITERDGRLLVTLPDSES
jgi:3-phenylpropionate/trans-cinnamate dioxygenase ferredoxin subunit